MSEQEAVAGQPDENVESVAAVSEAEIEKQIKPLSQNGFVRFFQKLWRGYLSAWHSFADKHPKLAKIIYVAGFFVLFSQGVTILQFLVFYLGTGLLSEQLAGNNWGLPLIKMGVHSVTGEPVYFRILGAAPRFDSNGVLISGIGAGGLAYFIMFMIGTFLAQVINFPLQRNITFRSHGNPYYQAMWYAIGWILVQPATMALGSAWEGIVAIHLGSWPGFVITLLNTLIMGGVSMVIFFLIFMIIFPDYNKVAKSKKAQLEKMEKAGISGEKLEKAKAAYADAEIKAKVSNAEKEARKTESQASSKAMAYFATMRNIDKIKVQVAALEAEDNAEKTEATEKSKAKLVAMENTLIARRELVSQAIAQKEKAEAEFIAAKAEKEQFDSAKVAA